MQVIKSLFTKDRFLFITHNNQIEKHTSTVFHENESFINTRTNLINCTTKVCNGILVTRQKFLENFSKEEQ